MNDANPKGSSSLVEVRDLHKSFQHNGGEIPVLRGINLDLGVGEMVAVVGASGAGKSTFLHVLGTLDAPTRGMIRFGGVDLQSLSGRKLARFRNQSIGFVFQFHHLLAEFTALENTMMPVLISGLSRSEAERRSRAILEEMSLSHRLTHKPGELSGGEQQRVALARALVLDPALLLADEPTGNLDSVYSAQIHDLLFEINRQHRTTILLVTHNQELAGRMPRILRMRDGVLTELSPGETGP